MDALSAAARAIVAATTLCAAVRAADFSTWVGDGNDYRIARIAADGAGNTYLGGTRIAGGLSEAVLIKLDPTGRLVAFALLNGKGNDTVNDLAIDPAGNIYLAGGTTSPALPVQNAYQAAPGPGFLAKFAADGARLLYCSYFPEAIAALAVDSAGGMYVTGSTIKPAFPVTPGLPSGPVGGSVPLIGAAFLTKLSPDGLRIVYSGLFSGTGKNCGAGSSCFLSSRSASGIAVTVDAAGNAYVAGNTEITNLPVTEGAFLKTGPGAWIAKVNAAGTGLVYLTYISNGNFVLTPFSSPQTRASALAVDAAGNAYVVGTTVDPAFPATPGAYQTTAGNGGGTPDSPTDAFVTKINPTGTALAWATYLGRQRSDAANSVALDPAGAVWVAGTTASEDFPNAQGWSNGGDFLVALNASGSSLTYAARYPGGAVSRSLVVDPAGTLHATGPAGLVSGIVPSATPSPRIVGIGNAAYGPLGGRIVSGEIVSIYGPHIGPRSPVTGTADSSGRFPAELGGVQLLIDGSPARLLYVSDSQVNAAADCFPCRTAQVVLNGVRSPEFPIAEINADPEVFQNTDGSAAALNQDGTINSASNPAAAGSVVSIWITGAPVPTGLAGQVATQAINTNCCEVRLRPSIFSFLLATAPDSIANVFYAGSSPGLVSAVVQINFQVPNDLQAGESTIGVNLKSGGATSAAPATIYVRPAP